MSSAWNLNGTQYQFTCHNSVRTNSCAPAQKRDAKVRLRMQVGLHAKSSFKIVRSKWELKQLENFSLNCPISKGPG